MFQRQALHSFLLPFLLWHKATKIDGMRYIAIEHESVHAGVNGPQWWGGFSFSAGVLCVFVKEFGKISSMPTLSC